MAAEIPDGAFIVARAIFNSSVWTMRDEDRILAITCIGMANWRERRWFDGKKSITIRRGEFVTSRDKLAEAAKLSVKNIRTSLKNLAKSGFLALKPASRYTLVCLPKYDLYQDLDHYYGPKDGPTTARPRPDYGPTTARLRPDGGHKQEGEEREEGEEGPAPTNGTGTNIEVCLDAFRKFTSPSKACQEAEIKDLLRQGVETDRILAQAKANPHGDFFSVLKPLRNHHSTVPYKPTPCKVTCKHSETKDIRKIELSNEVLVECLECEYRFWKTQKVGLG